MCPIAGTNANIFSILFQRYDRSECASIIFARCPVLPRGRSMNFRWKLPLEAFPLLIMPHAHLSRYAFAQTYLSLVASTFHDRARMNTLLYVKMRRATCGASHQNRSLGGQVDECDLDRRTIKSPTSGLRLPSRSRPERIVTTTVRFVYAL